MENYFFRNDLYKKKINIIEVEEKDINLSLNESPFNPLSFLSENDYKEIIDFQLNKYPSKSLVEKLKKKLCEYNNNLIKEENLLLGNGIDELLYFLFISIADKNSRILVSYPTYPDYVNYSLSCGVDNISITLNNDFQLNVDKIINLGKRKDVKMIIICTPNNPTGNLIKKSDIFYILENIHDKLIIVDEAYFEFSNETFIKNLYDYENLVILRSFSKGFFASGLRFGYIIANSFIINELLKVKSVFNLSSLTQFIALKLLEKLDIIKKHIDILINQREIMYNELLKINQLEVYRSYTNFILFRVDKKYDYLKLYNYFLENNISVRNVSSQPMLERCLRVSIGNEEQNKKFIETINNFFSAR